MSGDTNASEARSEGTPRSEAQKKLWRMILDYADSKDSDLREDLIEALDQLFPPRGPWCSHGVSFDQPCNDCVICPHCVLQFQAVPVNVQRALVATEARLAGAREALKQITSMGSNTDPWPVETAMLKIARTALAAMEGEK